MTTVSATLVVSSVYWLLVALMPSVSVSVVAWAALFLACLCCTLLVSLLRVRLHQATTWLYVAACSALLAVAFFGANLALDALHGVGRPKVDVAASLGGLELWFVLCPGVTSVALAGAAASLVAKYCGRTAHSPDTEALVAQHSLPKHAQNAP